MNKKNLLAVGLPFLALLLCSADDVYDGPAVFEGKKVQVEYMHHPDHADGTPATYEMKVTFREANFYEVVAGGWEYYMDGTKQRRRTVEVELSKNAGLRYATAGSSAVYTWEIPYEILWPNNYCIWMAIVNRYDEAFHGPVNWESNHVAPSSERIVPSSGTTKREYEHLYWEYEEGVRYIRIASKTMEFSGFASSFTDYKLNTVPLMNMRVRESYIWGGYMTPRYTSATLYALNNTSKFTIGRNATYMNATRRAFDLEFYKATSNNFYGLRLKDTTAVSPDGRNQRPLSQKQPNDVATKYIYLPPVKTGESVTYDFVLELTGAGNGACTTYTHAFSYTKTKNIAGFCENSDYCIVEV